MIICDLFSFYHEGEVKVIRTHGKDGLVKEIYNLGKCCHFVEPYHSSYHLYDWRFYYCPTKLHFPYPVRN
jgi:hypothetical protein